MGPQAKVYASLVLERTGSVYVIDFNYLMTCFMTECILRYNPDYFVYGKRIRTLLRRVVQL